MAKNVQNVVVIYCCTTSQQRKCLIFYSLRHIHVEGYSFGYIRLNSTSHLLPSAIEMMSNVIFIDSKCKADAIAQLDVQLFRTYFYSH